MMKDRHIKVYESPGLKYNIPRIVLQGKWLSEIGYNIGNQIRVSYQDGKLIIELEQHC